MHVKSLWEQHLRPCRYALKQSLECHYIFPATHANSLKYGGLEHYTKQLTLLSTGPVSVIINYLTNEFLAYYWLSRVSASPLPLTWYVPLAQLKDDDSSVAATAWTLPHQMARGPTRQIRGKSPPPRYPRRLQAGEPTARR